MAMFPSSAERTVASALIILSIKPHFMPPAMVDIERKLLTDDQEKKSSSEEESFSLESGGSLSCFSIHSDVTSSLNQAKKLQVSSITDGYHEIKVKGVRKTRSKVCRSSDKVTSVNTAPKLYLGAEDSTEASSCLSNSSSVSSSAVRLDQRWDEVVRKELGKMSGGGGSAPIRRRAEDILKMLHGSCASEVKIRQVLGDSPDTSKALRMLLKMEEIKRCGAGGRQDPYIYTIA